MASFSSLFAAGSGLWPTPPPSPHGRGAAVLPSGPGCTGRGGGGVNSPPPLTGLRGFQYGPAAGPRHPRAGLRPGLPRWLPPAAFPCRAVPAVLRQRASGLQRPPCRRQGTGADCYCWVWLGTYSASLRHPWTHICYLMDNVYTCRNNHPFRSHKLFATCFFESKHNSIRNGVCIWCAQYASALRDSFHDTQSVTQCQHYLCHT